MHVEWWWWVVAGLGLGIIEVLTVDLIFLMLAIAAIVAGLGSLLGLPVVGQVILFAVAALVLLVLVRPWAKSHLLRSTPDVRTNAQSLIGLEAVALTRLSGADGRVRLAGDAWSARTFDSTELPAGTPVKVISIDGATAVVGPVDMTVATPSDQVA